MIDKKCPSPPAWKQTFIPVSIPNCRRVVSLNTLFLLLVAVSIAIAAQAERATAQEDGLIVWLKLDEGSGNEAADSSGNGNHGFMAGTPQWIDGFINGALQINNVPAAEEIRQWIEIAPALNQNLESTVTLASWIRIDEPVEGAGILTKGQNITSYALRLAANGALMFTANFGEPFGFVGSGTWRSQSTISDAQWHHVAVTYDGSAIRFYIDGQQDANVVPVTLVFGRASQPLYVGADLPDDDQFFDGDVDDVRVYDRVLSNEEISLLASPSNRPPVLLLPATINSTEGDTIQLQLLATDPDDDPLLFTALNLPPGLLLQKKTGLITGVIGRSGIASFQTKITVSDGQNQVSESVIWIVRPRPTSIPSATSTATSTPSPQDTATATITPTDTPVPPSSTPTVEPTNIPTSVPTEIATAEPTKTPTLTPTEEPEPTRIPAPGGQTTVPQIVQNYLLYDDANRDRVVSFGDTILMQTVITNGGAEDLSGLQLFQSADVEMDLIEKSIWIIQNDASSGEQLPESSFPINLPMIESGDTLIVAYRYRINSTLNVATVELNSQAWLQGDQLARVDADPVSILVVMNGADGDQTEPSRLFLPLIG